MGITGFVRQQVDGAPPTLDASQQRVIDLPDGESAMVLGAPGTGKTTTLIELVADRVSRGNSPDSTLVLAANRTSATELRDRLATRIGVPSNGPLARTVNSLAFSIVRADATRRAEPAPRLLTGAEQDAIIGELLAGHHEDGTGPQWPEHLGWQVRAQRAFRTELRELMMRAGEYGQQPADLQHLSRVHAEPAWAAVGEFLTDYRSVTVQFRHEYRDSVELVVEASRLIRDGGAPELDGLRLVLVDDLQEATRSTIVLLKALAAAGVAIVAFGDPDIASSAFRGAEPVLIGRFASTINAPHAVTIVLDSVHRHGGAIRQLVSTVAERIGTASAGRQRSARSDSAVGRVQTFTASTAAREIAAIARVLRTEHLTAGVPFSRMGVIVRSGGIVEEVTRRLALAEVPTRTSVGSTALADSPAARRLLQGAAIAVGHTLLDAEGAADMLTGPLGGLDALGLRRLRLALRHEELAAGGDRQSGELLVEALDGPGRLVTIDGAAAKAASRFASLLHRARTGATDSTIEETLWTLWDGSGLAADWLAQAEAGGASAADANTRLDDVVALFAAAKRFVERTPDAKAARFIDEVLGSDVPEDTLAAQAAADSVFVGTPSAVVGRAFDVVAVARLQDGVWPNPRVRGSMLGLQRFAEVMTGEDDVDARRQVMSDELRLFALAVSRATTLVLLTAVANEDESPSALLALAGHDPATDDDDDTARFAPMTLRGLVGRLRREVTEHPESDAASALALLADERVAGADPESWHGVRSASTEASVFDLSDDDDPVRVSPSRLHSFEESPVTWFVEQFGGGTTNTAAGLGTVIHAVMETSEDQTVEGLWEAVEARWPELSFDAEWLSLRQRRLARDMVQALANYLADFAAQDGRLVGAESRFSLRIGPAQLNGSIDRVEQFPDGRVVIVDLKTGKNEPRTDAGVANHPQLASYQLAVDAKVIVGIPDGATPGGAKLVLIGGLGAPYAAPAQQPFSPEQIAEFRQKVERIATEMAGPDYRQPAEKPGRPGRFDIHQSGSVAE